MTEASFWTELVATRRVMKGSPENLVEFQMWCFSLETYRSGKYTCDTTRGGVLNDWECEER